MMVLWMIGSGVFSPKAYAQSNATIRLAADTTFQTIEGFGAFNTLSFWRDKSDTAKYRFVAEDLGLSIMRFELPPTFRPRQDSAYDPNGKVFGGPDMQHNFKDVRGLHQLGIDKFIASIWSPPAWMKTLNEDHGGPSTIKGGSLREDAYQEFAAYCVAYCKTFRAQTGVELFGLGLQNEPEFAEPYNSCVYNPQQLREALRYVGRAFKKAGIHTKIYVPEALPAQHHLMDFFEAINDDSETRQYADVFAIHNYDKDGMHVGGAGARQWESYFAAAHAVSPAKELWMTETSGHANTWQGAMLLAANIYNALKYGQINAWMWWALADKDASSQFALIVDGKPSGRYFASKHFYHFIRPGAVRIAAESNNEDVLSLGFVHSGIYRTVIVLMNKGAQPATVHLPEVQGVRTFYLSTATEHCALQQSSGQDILLPAQSIATVCWK
jgi:O-glycosyl hydrolase